MQARAWRLHFGETVRKVDFLKGTDLFENMVFSDTITAYGRYFIHCLKSLLFGQEAFVRNTF